MISPVSRMPWNIYKLTHSGNENSTAKTENRIQDSGSANDYIGYGGCLVKLSLKF